MGKKTHPPIILELQNKINTFQINIYNKCIFIHIIITQNQYIFHYTKRLLYRCAIIFSNRELKTCCSHVWPQDGDDALRLMSNFSNSYGNCQVDRHFGSMLRCAAPSKTIIVSAFWSVALRLGILQFVFMNAYFSQYIIIWMTVKMPKGGKLIAHYNEYNQIT